MEPLFDMNLGINQTDKEMLEHIMSTDHTEVIVKASKEQIQALSQEEEGRGNSTAPFNLLDMQPLVHNNYGQIFYVSPTEYRALEDLDIGVGFVNITQVIHLPFRTNWLKVRRNSWNSNLFFYCS